MLDEEARRIAVNIAKLPDLLKPQERAQVMRIIEATIFQGASGGATSIGAQSRRYAETIAEG